ncbi:MAG: ABC transporter permease [Chromatiales bacterium]|nr:ABC transporter permease [Chromatiales bacterium]
MWRRNSIGYATIARKKIRRFMQMWVQTLVPPVITTTLYFLIFGQLIGKRVGQMGGFDYMDYIVPGLILMTVITNAYANVSSSFYPTKFQRHIEEMLASPMPNWVILSGYITGGVVRGMFTAAIVTGVALVFANVPMKHPLLMLIVVFLTAVLFSCAGFINACLARNFDDVSVVPTFILTPLTYLGGVFYTVTLLPDGWRAVSFANPILYMVNAFRFSVLGVSDIGLDVSLTLLVVFVAGFGWLSHWLLERGVGIKH